MLGFFRRYQRFFFFFVTVIIVASFILFGTFDTFSRDSVKEDPVVATAVDGSPLKLSEVTLMSRFLSADREDLMTGFGVMPNLCNDGVLRNDLLKTGLSDLVVSFYFDSLKGDLQERFERMKKYRPYVHPEASFLSVRSIWERFAPDMIRELDALQKEESATPKTFTHLVKIYSQERSCPPEFVRRVLGYYFQQFSWITPDPAFQYEDFSMFGFHSLSDWFGRDFVDLSSEFILNTARLAEAKGYAVSLEEAKSDLLCNFNASMQKLKAANIAADMTFQQHLHSLGFDENTAADVWRSVLLFRRYFHGVGNAAFVDRLPFKDFAEFAQETSVVRMYELPQALHLKDFQDLLEFQVYLQLISNNKDLLALPSSVLALDTIERKGSELVQTTYRAKVAETTLGMVGLRATLKEVLDWALQPNHWIALRAKFPVLEEGSSRDERFYILDKLDAALRLKVDAYVRSQLVLENPHWIDEQLRVESLKERTIFASKGWVSLQNIHEPEAFISLVEGFVQGEERAKASLFSYRGQDDVFYRFEEIEKVADRHLLTFQDAKDQGILKAIADRYLESEYLLVREKYVSSFQEPSKEWKPFHSVKEDVARIVFADLLRAIGGVDKSFSYLAAHRLEIFAKEAIAAFQKNPQDLHFLKTGEDPILDQFKFEEKEYNVQRTNKEAWMKDQVFVMNPHQWSEVHVAPDGKIAFFYFEGKKTSEPEILDRLRASQAVIAGDAKRYVAERLLATVKQQNAMIVPLNTQNNRDEP